MNNFSDCKINLIEETTKENRSIRERFWVEHYGDQVVNRQIPGRTNKIYKQQHSEELKEWNKQYYQHHADEIREKQKEWHATKITCACGSIFSQGNKSKHLRTKKHKDYQLTQLGLTSI